MVRLRNAAGAVVNVPEGKVARLGPDWARVDVDAPVGADYGSWTLAFLRDQVRARNEGRDGLGRIVPLGAKKADLVAALEADDVGAR